MPGEDGRRTDGSTARNRRGDDGPSGGQPADTMRGRVPESRVAFWLLLGGSRWVVTGLLAAAVFLALVALGAGDPSPLRAVMADADPVETLYQAFVAAIVTGVTLVVTINQLVLSQELGAVGDQRERMRGALDFRRDAEDVLDEAVSPAEPSAFLAALVAATAERARAVADAADGSVEEPLADEIASFVDGLAVNAAAVADELDGAEFGSFAVVSAALDFNYSFKLHRARRLRADLADPDGPAGAALDDLVDALALFGPAREHVKTLYFQWELVDLSRALLAVAVPALVVAVSVLLYLDRGLAPGTTVGVDNLVWVVSATSTVSVLPFLLLLAYVLRIATVAKRTLAVGPFILRSTGKTDGREE